MKVISGTTGGHVHDAVSPISIRGEVDQHQVAAGSLNRTVVSIHQDGHRPDSIIECINGDPTTNLYPPPLEFFDSVQHLPTDLQEVLLTEFLAQRN